MAASKMTALVATSAEEAVRRAHVSYVTDPDRRSLEHWWGQHARPVIGWSSFRRRAFLGRWTEERDLFWREVSAQVLRERAGALAAAQVRELEELDRARQVLLANVAKMKPRSLEGVVAALVALDRRADEKRAAVLERLGPLVEQDRKERAERSPFDHEEARVVARSLLELRLQRQRAQLAQAASGSGAE